MKCVLATTILGLVLGGALHVQQAACQVPERCGKNSVWFDSVIKSSAIHATWQAGFLPKTLYIEI